jgi:hypothetical protein
MRSYPANWLRKLRSHQGYFVVVFAFLYFGAIPLGNTFLITQGQAVSFWPAAGLFLAALLLSRMRHWPFIILAAIGAEAAANGLLFGSALGWGRATLAGAIFGFTNGLEAFAGAFLLRRFVRISPNLAKLQSVLGLVWWGGVVGTTVGATVGSTFLIILYPVRAFLGVGEQRIVFLHQSIEPVFKIMASRWISVLLNHQTRGCVLNENGAEPGCNVGLLHDVCDLAGDEVQALTTG